MIEATADNSWYAVRLRSPKCLWHFAYTENVNQKIFSQLPNNQNSLTPSPCISDDTSLLCAHLSS